MNVKKDCKKTYLEELFVHHSVRTMVLHAHRSSCDRPTKKAN